MRLKIIVPKSAKEVENLYVYDFITDKPDQIKLTLTFTDYKLLYDNHIWNGINEVANSKIDYGEEEDIIDMEKLEKVKKYLLKYVSQNPETEVSKILLKIIELIKEAEKRKTGLFFIL